MAHLWNQSGVPHRGWRCVDVIDLRPNDEPVESVDYATCEMCGHEQIRFVHIMEHDEYDGRLSAGCICAEKMLGDSAGPKQREQRLRNKATRKRNWLSLKWKVSKKGNPWLKKDGMVLTVFADTFRHGYWGYGIDGAFSKGKYASEDAAKLALFEAYWDTLSD